MENEIVYRNVDGQAVTNSLLVAESFGKLHKNVMQDIEELFVKENFRGMGIGKSFFEFLENNLSGKINRIRLEVGEENEDAIRLYKRIGFEFLDYRQMVYDKEF